MNATHTPWRDANGREYPEIPRCEAYTQPRGFMDKHGHPCHRRGLRRRVDAPGWKGEHHFCEQHDPARPKAEDLQGQVCELRSALAAVLPAARFALNTATPETLARGSWRAAVRRAEHLVEGA